MIRTIAALFAGVLALGSFAAAQQKPQPQPAQEKPAATSSPTEAPKPFVPVKVQILLTRLKGDKKISSLPYMLSVTANDGNRSSLRMGIEVPVIQTVFGGSPKEGAMIPQASFSYKNVGTNIDCRADSVSGDQFRLQLTIVDTSIHLERADSPAVDKRVDARDYPAFRSFNSTFTVLARSGQTTQYTSAVDPVNGEIMKVDVTLEVVK